MLTFRAMNTDITITASQQEAAVAAGVLEIFERAEQRFSRFREDSELSRLNRASGPFRVSAELFELLVRARSYVAMTGGIFDPAVGGAMLALGYDRSFSPGALDHAFDHPLDHPLDPLERLDGGPRPAPASVLDLLLDGHAQTVTRPPQLQLDLGGLAKGATVDRAAALLGSSGAIDAGGDAYLRGHTEEDEPWLVEVEDPRDASRTVATVAVCNQAVATSASNRRRWRVGGRWVHHLIDPRTQTSAVTDLLQATVFAPTAELAEVLAKTAFILGSRLAPRWLAHQPRVAAVLIPQKGPPAFVGALDLREVGHA